MSGTIRFLSTPCQLGHVLLAAGDRGICQLRLGNDPSELERRLVEAFPEARRPGRDDPLRGWCRAIVSYLDSREGATAPPELPLELRGTPFQRRVWAALREIPSGEVRRYGELARDLGVPGGAQAVAGACARNPVALLVPCHRVVPRTNGTGGYRWGRWRKEALLAHEQRPGPEAAPSGTRDGGLAGHDRNLVTASLRR